MLLPVSCYSTSRRPCECLESCYVSVQVTVLLDMLFLNYNKYQYTYLNTYILPPACPTFYVLYGMTKKGCVKVGLPVKGVSSGRVGSWLTGERALRGDGNSFPFVVWLLLVILACKSIVLCKCSGKYIDIYFSLKITFSCNSSP